MTNQLPVRLILDRSALLGYLDGSIHVGEVLHEVTADRVLCGIPVVVLGEAEALIATGKDFALLRQLIAGDACTLLGLDDEDWQEYSYWRRVTGRSDLAAAALAAFAHDASVLTAEGGRYGGDVPAIHFPGTR